MVPKITPRPPKTVPEGPELAPRRPHKMAPHGSRAPAVGINGPPPLPVPTKGKNSGEAEPARRRQERWGQVGRVDLWLARRRGWTRVARLHAVGQQPC